MRFEAKLKLALATLPGLALLGGCSTANLAKVETQKLAKFEVPIQLGPAVRDNRTPMEASLACYADHLAAARAARSGGSPGPIVITVGDVKDFTGKYSINEGNAVTQGGSLMVYSALGKLNGSIALAERFDPTIAERELAYLDRRQLGDGSIHNVNGQKVPWLPYFGGSIAMSDFYIVGGITELNYNIQSGGSEVAVNNIGAKGRTYNQSVAVDLRIVNSRTLMVEKTVSLQKQFTGYEVGAGVFRFFGVDLFDINIGEKGQEPLQLGIRTALEEATVRLLGAATGVDPKPCLELATTRIPDQPADALRGTFEKTLPPKLIANRPKTGGRPAADASRAELEPLVQSLNASGQAADASTELQVKFEFGDASIGGSMQTVLDQIAARARQGIVDFTIVARDTENWDPGKRDALLTQRIQIVAAALLNRGVAAGAIAVIWRPDPSDTSIHRDGPGFQNLAKIRIGR